MDKKLHSINLIGEWHKKEMTDNLIRVRKLMEDIKKFDLDPKSIDKILEENNETRITLISILNFFERLCLSMEINVADDDILKKYFMFIFRVYWSSFQEFIKYRRKQ